MMKVFEVGVRFRRSVQPKQYESIEAEVEFKAQARLEESEDHVATAAALMIEARNVVIENGLKGVNSGKTTAAAVTAEKTLTKTAADGTNTTTAVAETAGGATPDPSGIPGDEDPKSDPEAAAGDIPDEKPKRTRRTKTQMEADAAAAKAAAADPSGMPGADSGAPAADPEDWETAAGAEPAMDAAGLQAHISKKVKEGKTTVPGVKAILAEYGAQRCGDLSVDDIAKVKVKIDAL